MKNKKVILKTIAQNKNNGVDNHLSTPLFYHYFLRFAN